MKIITGIKDEILHVYVGDNNYIIDIFHKVKIKKDDFQIDNQTYIKSLNGDLIKVNNNSQFIDIPKLINRLFCYIDDKNNIWLSSGYTNMIFFGNLSSNNNEIFINKIDLKYPNDTLHRTSFFNIIENNELNTIKYIVSANEPKIMKNLHIGYIEIPDNYIFSKNDIKKDKDKYKVGCIIRDKLYNNSISLKILCKVINGEIFLTNKLEY